MAPGLLVLLLGVECICHWAAADVVQCQVADDDFCKCSSSNLTLDLRRMGLSFPVSTKDAADKYEYSYTPCQPVVCGDSGGAASVLCQVRTDTKAAYSVGRYNPFNWTITSFNPLAFEIVYGGGDKAGSDTRSSVVLFEAASGSTQFTYEREATGSLTYYFDVTGSRVSPDRGGGGGGPSSSGDISGPIGLAIIFLALGGLVAYFVVGGIFMYTQRGARGVEVIPNYTFWKDLPFLLKDGFLFTISPCYKGRDGYHGL
ncbi:Cation-dependent mannose-6-phosphate receptor [Geodia barretti]|nr:Cation-dependent mannose-6-phosphate receptor [Geodia barretti]